jgi:hypothetical protein
MPELMLKKHGVDNYVKTDEYKDKKLKTNLLKYEESHPNKNSNIKNKIRNTWNAKSKLEYEEIIEKVRNTWNNKTDAVMSDINKKRKITRINKKLQIADELTNEFTKYKILCDNITRKNKKELFTNWDGIDFYDNEYIKDNFQYVSSDKRYPTIDHKISIFSGFKNKIDPNIIGSILNLCITTRSNNSSKHIKNYIEVLNIL